MYNFSDEQLEVFNMHPVIAYFGMDTFVEAVQWYMTQEDPAAENAAIVESRMLRIILNDHERFFSMVEDYVDAFGA